MNTDKKMTEYTAKLSGCLQAGGVPNLYKHGMTECIILKKDVEEATRIAVEAFVKFGFKVCTHKDGCRDYATIELEGEDLRKTLNAEASGREVSHD